MKIVLIPCYAFNSLGQIACKELKRTGPTCSGSSGPKGGCLPMTWYEKCCAVLFSRFSALQLIYNLKIIQALAFYLLRRSICYECSLLVQMKKKFGMNSISMDNTVPERL